MQPIRRWACNPFSLLWSWLKWYLRGGWNKMTKRGPWTWVQNGHRFKHVPPYHPKWSVINLLFRTCMFYSTSFQDFPPNLFQCVMLAFAAMLHSCPRQLGEIHLHPGTWHTMACNPFVGGLATHSPYIAHQGRGSFSTRAVQLKFILLSFISSKQPLTARSFTPGIVIHCVGKFIILWISPFETATCTHRISHSMNFVWLVIDNELR